MEYARYANGFIKREDADHEWEAAAEVDIPAAELEEILRVEARKQHFIDHGRAPDAEPVGGVLLEGNQPAPNSEALLRRQIEELLGGTGVPGE